jgi:YHS domain-containing protein
MKVASTSRYRTTFNGADYVFCGPGCRDRFTATPAQYQGGGDYSCPADPDVHSNSAGKCRKCGQPLQLTTPAHPSP